jgi:hypothetical protein
METAIMPKQSVAVIIRVFVAVFFAGLLSTALPATPCRGSDRASPAPTITLDVQNEPLRSVLERISTITTWKIKAPDKWMGKPITQTLNKVSLEEGLRFILKDAGVENLLLTYDEDRKTIIVYDTEIKPAQSANRPPVQGDVRPPIFPPSDQSDPMLTRPANEGESGPSRGNTRMRNRRQLHKEQEED